MTATPAVIKKKPLAGRRIVVTRPRAQAQVFVDLLEREGAEVVCFPTIEIVPMPSYERLDAALAELSSYEWLMFTSVNGVSYFLKRLQECHLSITALQHLKVAAIGPETARVVEEIPLSVTAVPEEYRAEALVPLVGDVRGKRILLPRAAGAREVLPRELAALGALVNEIAVYDTVCPSWANTEELRASFLDGMVDMVTFTSSSTVRNFCALFAQDDPRVLLKKTQVGCIGPITGDTARTCGLTVALQSSVYTIPGFTRAIVEYFRKGIRGQQL